MLSINTYVRVTVKEFVAMLSEKSLASGIFFFFLPLGYPKVNPLKGFHATG